jgi:hypothetical protein
MLSEAVVLVQGPGVLANVVSCSVGLHTVPGRDVHVCGCVLGMGGQDDMEQQLDWSCVC